MTIEDVSARLEKLERQNRRMRAGGIGALVLIAAVSLLGQAAAPEKVIRAQRFEVVDAAGTFRAGLETTSDGSPWLRLDGKGGGRRVLLGVPASGIPEMSLWDGDGKRRIFLGLGRDGSPAMSFIDRGDRDRMALSLAPEGSPSLLLSDKDGKVIDRMPR